MTEKNQKRSAKNAKIQALEQQLYLSFYDTIIDEKIDLARVILEDPFLDIEQLEKDKNDENQAEMTK